MLSPQFLKRIGIIVGSLCGGFLIVSVSFFALNAFTDNSFKNHQNSDEFAFLHAAAPLEVPQGQMKTFVIDNISDWKGTLKLTMPSGWEAHKASDGRIVGLVNKEHNAILLAPMASTMDETPEDDFIKVMKIGVLAIHGKDIRSYFPGIPDAALQEMREAAEQVAKEKGALQEELLSMQDITIQGGPGLVVLVQSEKGKHAVSLDFVKNGVWVTTSFGAMPADLKLLWPEVHRAFATMEFVR